MPMRATLPVFIGSLLLAGAVWTSVASAKDRALVIGVNNYPDILVNGAHGQKDLSGAVFDAHTFADLLKEQFHVAADDIHTLFDSQATRKAILAEFQTWLIDGTAAGDRVFFYFAGHGIAIKVIDEATGASRMTSGIVPADASGDLSTTEIEVKGLILGVETRRLLDRIKNRTVVFVADSCQSGSVSRAINNPYVVPPNIRVRTLTPSGAVGMTTESFAADTAMRREAKDKGRLLDVQADPTPTAQSTAAAPPSVGAPPSGSLSVWAAATTDQVTFDLNDRPGGIFTQSFAEGLRDKKAVSVAGGDITAGALLNYVRDQANSFCTAAGKACSAGLTPQLTAPSNYLTEAVTSFGDTHTATAPSVHEAPAQGAPGAVTADKLTALLSHKNDFNVEVAVLPGTRLRIGQSVQFRVTSSEAGNVAVFDLTPDGDLAQIFPNTKTDRVGRIRAHTPLFMPDAYWGMNFKVTPPAGPGSLLVLVTETEIDLTKATSRSADLKPLPRLLQVIGEEVEKPVISSKLEEPTRAARWAFVRVPYSVIP